MSDSIIFVPLSGEGTSVWRPVPATHCGSNAYQLDGVPAEEEEWQFSSGSVVECRFHTFSDGTTGLVAVRVLEELVFCPAIARTIYDGKCWEYCFADQGGPTDTAAELQEWISKIGKFASLEEFHKVCATCPHCHWSRK